MLRLTLFLLGLLTLVGLVWHVGPARILDAVAGVGPVAILMILLPSFLMYVLEALGWRLTLGRHSAAVSFGRLFAIRTAGEVVNMTTPTAYVGGEPLKAYLLKKQGVPMVDGLASVVTAKTTMTIAQVGFILLGIALGFWILGSSGSSTHAVLAASVSVGLLLFGTVIFVVVQRRGLFTGLLGVLRRLRIRIGFLEVREEKLQALDRAILDFYARDRRAFLFTTGAFFLGWLAEALEVYMILHYLGGPTDLLSAISIGAISVFIKGGTFFIPGSLGAQDGGNLLLLVAFGYSELTGITFALLRRVRELVWIAIGLLCLAVMGGPGTELPIQNGGK
ncbi:MAG TPA: lysylphosphatidylglycerol synthase transmembrane domain-containing protein [Nitrospiraceae bacterium]|nr:lysylphosphatidylglycerol synthase transmembrane domain-containing protein [Nitrospiraceae bacterium]